MNESPRKEDSPEENDETMELNASTAPAPTSESSPAPAAGTDAPFVPVRRSMWKHFTYCLRHYADFSGRATRAEFWSFQLWLNAIVFLFITLALMLASVLFVSVAEESVGAEEMERYVELASTEGVSGITRELAESAKAGDGGSAPSGVEANGANGADDGLPRSLSSEELETEVERAIDAVEVKLTDGFNRLAEEGPYPWIMIGGVLCLTALSILFSLVTLIPSLAVTWRRLHDVGLSGAWFLLALTPYVGNLIILVLTLLDSKPGANRFGPATKYP